MTQRRRDDHDSDSREARLAAALRANLARRKAQARARADDGNGADDESDPETGREEKDGQ